MPSDTVVMMTGNNSQSVTVQLHEVASESSFEGTTEVEDDDEEEQEEEKPKGRFGALGEKLSNRFGAFMEKAKESDMARNLTESKYFGGLAKFYLRMKEYWQSPEAQKFKKATSSWFLGESDKLKEEVLELGFWSSMVGEYIGTLLLVVIGCGAASPELARLRFKETGGVINDDQDLNETKELPPMTGLPLDEDRLSFDIYVSICFGFTYAVALFALHHGNDGHLNPSVSLAMFVTHRQGFFRVTIYIACQFLGAICGAYCLSCITPAELNSALGSTNLAPDVGWWQGFAVEFVSTFLLVFVVLSCYSVRKSRDKNKNTDAIVPFIIGLTVITCSLFACPYTRGSLNTVRSFGPAYVSGMWENHWVYWFGPLMGGVAGGMSQEVVFGKSALFRRIQAHFLRQYHLSPAVSAFSINTTSSMSVESLPQTSKSSSGRKGKDESKDSKRQFRGKTSNDFRQRASRSGSESDLTSRKEIEDGRQRSGTLDSYRGMGGRMMSSDMKGKSFKLPPLEDEEDSEDPVYRGSELSDDDSNASDDADVTNNTLDDVDNAEDGDDERDDSKTKRMVKFDIPLKKPLSCKKTIGTNTRLSLVNIADETKNEDSAGRVKESLRDFSHSMSQSLTRESYVSHPPPTGPPHTRASSSGSYYGATDSTHQGEGYRPPQRSSVSSYGDSKTQIIREYERPFDQPRRHGSTSTSVGTDTGREERSYRPGGYEAAGRDDRSYRPGGYEAAGRDERSYRPGGYEAQGAGREERSYRPGGAEATGGFGRGDQYEADLLQRKKTVNISETSEPEKQDPGKAGEKSAQSSKTSTPLKSALKEGKSSESATSSPSEKRKSGKNKGTPISILKKPPEKDPRELQDELKTIGDNLASAWLKSESSSKENLAGSKPAIAGLEIKSVLSDLEKQSIETEISEPLAEGKRQPSPAKIETYDKSPPHGTYTGPAGPRTLSTSNYGDTQHVSPVLARKAVSQEIIPSGFSEYKSSKSPNLPRSSESIKSDSTGSGVLTKDMLASLTQGLEAAGIGAGPGQQKVHSPVVIKPTDTHTMVTSAVMHSAYFSPIGSPRAERKAKEAQQAKQPSPPKLSSKKEPAESKNAGKKPEPKQSGVATATVKKEQQKPPTIVETGPKKAAPKKAEPKQQMSIDVKKTEQNLSTGLAPKFEHSPAVSPLFSPMNRFFGPGIRPPTEAQERERLRKEGKPFTGEFDEPKSPGLDDGTGGASRSLADIILHPTGNTTVLTKTEDNEITFIMKEAEEIKEKQLEVDVDAIEGRVEDLSEGEYSPLGGMIRSDEDEDSSDAT